MKNNLFVLLVIVIFASMTFVFAGVPKTTFDCVGGFIVCFLFWLGMLCPALKTSKKVQRYGFE